MTVQVSCNVFGCRCGTTTAPLHARSNIQMMGFQVTRDDRITGYATENVVPVTNDEADALLELLAAATRDVVVVVGEQECE